MFGKRMGPFCQTSPETGDLSQPPAADLGEGGWGSKVVAWLRRRASSQNGNNQMHHTSMTSRCHRTDAGHSSSNTTLAACCLPRYCSSATVGIVPLLPPITSNRFVLCWCRYYLLPLAHSQSLNVSFDSAAFENIESKASAS